MSKKTDIKTCRYAKCSHPDKKIDISKDDYKVNGTMIATVLNKSVIGKTNRPRKIYSILRINGCCISAGQLFSVSCFTV